MSFTKSITQLEKIIENLEKDVKEVELKTPKEKKEKTEKPKLKEVPKSDENDVISLFGKAHIQVIF